MAVMKSYDLKGKKDSFANWISNLSPTDTYFVSVTGKEQVKNTLFQWQTDSLAKAVKNAQQEGTAIITGDVKATTVHENYTQILRKAVEVTDTADVIDSWGRQKELAYQMEKAGKEIKRDLEFAFLNNTEKNAGDTSNPRETAGFAKLVGTGDDHKTPDPDTGAVVFKETAAAAPTETELFDMTYQLYLAGSDANVIMFHPEQASFFSSLMEVGVGRTKMIDNMDTKLNKFVGSVVDPLGQEFQLVPNRFMPKKGIYIFNPANWTQMVLREPTKVALSKKGSSERHMIEMEVGLRHRNPYASAVLQLK